ncbi:MAG: hypothetical protein HQM08_22065 [Candidatus Riflebacteria bacterium]|nr:hypothetical protein [Candidatus Riflebacteria bacterium]
MSGARERLSIDVTPEERRRVKAVAALSGKIRKKNAGLPSAWTRPEFYWLLVTPIWKKKGRRL